MANLRAKSSDSKVFIFSGLQDIERKDLAKKVSHLGAKYLDLKDFKSFCTHIITSRLTKSEKVLGGLATGKWILHPDYIHQSFIAGSWLDEEHYEFCDERIMRRYPSADEQLFYAPRRWRFMLGDHNSAFTGWKVAVIAGAKKAIVIKRLLISGGADVYNIQLPIRRPEKVADTIAYVFVSEQNIEAVTPLIDCGILCLRPEYIGDYLIKDPPPDIIDYVVQVPVGSLLEGTDTDILDQESFLMSTQTTFLSQTISTPDHHKSSPSVEPKPSSSCIDSGLVNNDKLGSSSIHVPITENTNRDRKIGKFESKAADIITSSSNNHWVKKKIDTERSLEINTTEDSFSKGESRKSVRLKSQEGKGSPVLKSLIPRSKTPVNREDSNHGEDRSLTGLSNVNKPRSSSSSVQITENTGRDWEIDQSKCKTADESSTNTDAERSLQTNSIKDTLSKGESRKSIRLKSQEGRGSPVWKSLIPRSKTPVNTEDGYNSAEHPETDKIGCQNKTGLAIFSPITKFFKQIDIPKDSTTAVTDINKEVNKALLESSQVSVDDAGDAGDRKEMYLTALATSTPMGKAIADGKTEEVGDKSKIKKDTLGNRVRGKKRLRTGAETGKSLTEEKAKDLPLPPLKAAVENMKSKTTSSMKQWFGKFKDGYKKLVVGYEGSKATKTNLNKSLLNEQETLTERSKEINRDDKQGNENSVERKAAKRKNDNLSEVLLDLKRKKVSASEWVPIDYVYNQKENESTEESLCLTAASTEIIHSMFEEGYIMSALQQLRDRISFRCVPQAKTLYILLFQILQNSQSDIEAYTAYDVLMNVLSLHPPITTDLQRLYLEMFSYKLEEEALVINEWLLIHEILYSVMQVEEYQTKRNSRLTWKVIKCMIKLNMQHFLLENNGKTTGQGTRHLIMKIFWSPSYHVVFNTRCRQLLDAVLETIILYRAQTDRRRKSELFKLLEDMMWLVSMIAETARLSQSCSRDGINSLTTETTSIFVHEISKRLIEADLNEPSLLSSIMSMLQLPWLCVGICQQILNTLDDYLLTDEQYLDMKIMSLTQIVKRYIFLLPRFHYESDNKPQDKYRQKKTEPLRSLNQNSKEDHVVNRNLFKKANKKNAKGETPLHTACIKNDLTSLKSLLKVPGIDVNVKDNAGWTPLHEACNHGHIECVQELLKFVPCKTVDVFFTQVVTKRANLLAVNPEGITPLHDAVLNNELEVCRLLLHHGGLKLLKMKTCLGFTALELANTDEMYQMLNSFCHKHQKHSDSQDSSLIGSQGSQESSSSCSLPVDDLYAEVLNHDAKKRYANMKYLQQYVHLITVLLQNYIEATRILIVVECLNTKLAYDKINLSKSSCENSPPVTHGDSMLGPSVSNEELRAAKEDLQVLRKLPKHVELFRKHLLKLCQPEDCDIIENEFKVLQLFVDNIMLVDFKGISKAL